MPEDLNSLAANYGLDPSAALLSYPGSQLFPMQAAPAVAPVQAAPVAPAAPRVVAVKPIALAGFPTGPSLRMDGIETNPAGKLALNLKRDDSPALGRTTIASITAEVTL